jgi:hypothetical protein
MRGEFATGGVKTFSLQRATEALMSDNGLEAFR